MYLDVFCTIPSASITASTGMMKTDVYDDGEESESDWTGEESSGGIKTPFSSDESFLLSFPDSYSPEAHHQVRE